MVLTRTTCTSSLPVWILCLPLVPAICPRLNSTRDLDFWDRGTEPIPLAILPGAIIALLSKACSVTVLLPLGVTRHPPELWLLRMVASSVTLHCLVACLPASGAQSPPKCGSPTWLLGASLPSAACFAAALPCFCSA